MLTARPGAAEHLVGGVDEDEFVSTRSVDIVGRGRWRECGQAHGVGLSDGGLMKNFERFEIAADDLGDSPPLLDEGAVPGPARQGLQAERSAAREEVEDGQGRQYAGLSKTVAEDVKEHGLRPVE